MATFGTTLKALREKAGLSQRALAEMAGVGQKSVSWWETDEREPTLSNIQKLCTALGVSCDVFFAAADPTQVQTPAPKSPAKGKPKKK